MTTRTTKRHTIYVTTHFVCEPISKWVVYYFYELVQRKSRKFIPFRFAQRRLPRLTPTVAQINPTTFVYKRSVGHF